MQNRLTDPKNNVQHVPQAGELPKEQQRVYWP
jgi:hypothetical protein